MTEVEVGGEIVTRPRRKVRVSKRAAWAAVTSCAVWAIARVAGADRSPALVALMTATPYVAAASALALLAAIRARSRGAIEAAIVTCAVMAAVVLPRAVPATPTATGPPLRILTVNLFFGQGDAATVVDLVRRLRPDLLTTQELDPDAVQRLDAAGIGALLPYRDLETDFSPSGSGIFARYPLTRLPDFAPEEGHNMPSARLSLPGGQAVDVVDVHTQSPTGLDVGTWEAGLADLPAPSAGAVRVLAGDFNATLDHVALRDVLAKGYVDAADQTGHGLLATWPANRRFPPLITIDHVLVDRRASAVATTVYAVPGTDHRALFAALRLPRR